MESISIIVSYLSLLVTLLYPYTYHRIPTPPRICTPSREGMVGRGPVGIYRVLGVDVDTSRTCIPLYPPHTYLSPAGDHSTNRKHTSKGRPRYILGIGGYWGSPGLIPHGISMGMDPIGKEVQVVPLGINL